MPTSLRSPLLPVVLVVLLASASNVTAQEAERDLVSEVSELNRSLERISVQLETLLRQRSANVLLKRIEVERARLAPMERELRGAREDIRNAEEERGNLEEMLRDAERGIDDETRQGVEPEQTSGWNMRLHAEREIKMLNNRVESAERRVIELENQLERGRRDVAILDERFLALLEKLESP